MSSIQEGAHDTPDGKQEVIFTVEEQVISSTLDIPDPSDPGSEGPNNRNEKSASSETKDESADHCGEEASGSGGCGGSNGASAQGDLQSCPDGFICDQANVSHAHINRALGFYLTKCEGIDKKYNADTFTRSLTQILSEDVGDTLVSAVHFSYGYDIEWLLEQYPVEYRRRDMLLVARQKKSGGDSTAIKMPSNVSLLPIQLKEKEMQHSKIISLEYKKSLRIVVTTANLCKDDWSNKSQMVWVSPPLKKVDNGKDSSTGFRSSMCDYLKSYGEQKLTDLAKSYAGYDFSPIQSYFIGSSPRIRKSGLVNLGEILKGNVCEISKECPLTFCFSSAGDLGPNDDEKAWIRSKFGVELLSSKGSSLSGDAVTTNNIKPIYPCENDMRDAPEGSRMNYRSKTHKEQEWLSKWLHKWKADRTGRSNTIPHVKFYIRTSEDYEKTYWFLMSSANLSRGAWGQLYPGASPLQYECGILHIPETPAETKDLVIPFDLPPKRYGDNDTPLFYETKIGPKKAVSKIAVQMKMAPKQCILVTRPFFSKTKIGPKKQCILVTGGAGYIGSHCIVELLEADYDVVAIDNFANALPGQDGCHMPESLERVSEITGKPLHFVACDLCDEDKLEEVFKQHKFDCVIHFAALKAVGQSCAEPLSYYKNNMGSTVALLNVMRKHNLRNIVFSSSATVYGLPQYLPVDENHPTGMTCANPYGRTKYFIEEMLKDVHKSEPGWNICLLRYFNTIGAHESGYIGEDPQGEPNNLMPYIAQVAVGRRDCLKVFGGDFPTPDGTGVRDYIHVVDLVKGHVVALEKILRGELDGLKVYNLGTSKGFSVLEVIRAFEEAAGVEIRYEIVGRRQGDVASLYADASLIDRELGWHAERSLLKMCEDSWRWQQSNPEGYITNRNAILTRTR